MKNLFPAIAIISLFSISSFAGSHAADRNYHFCEDITQVDKFLDRSRETTERIKAEGLKIERILISKERKELYLISGEVLLRSYPVAFGAQPVGHKQFQGDNKTPEGIYTIDYKNPDSQYTKSLHISYPNKADLAYAASQGQSAGGDIMIHGFPRGPSALRIQAVHPRKNWTQGCVAVNNEQIEDIYSLVQENTLVEICKMPEIEVAPDNELPSAPTGETNQDSDKGLLKQLYQQKHSESPYVYFFG